MLLSHLTPRYLEWLQFGREIPVTAQTLKTAKRNLSSVFKYLGDFEIQDLNQDEVSILRKIMLERGNSFATIRKILIQIRSVLRYAQDIEKLPVLHPLEIKLPKATKKVIQYLHLDELATLIEAINPNSLCGIRLAAFLAIALDTGIRVSEILALNRDSIDFTRCTATIIGKGRKEQVIFFHPWSLETVKTYLNLRTDDHPALFVNHDQGAISRCTVDGIDRYFNRLSQKLNIDVHPHKLRKTAARAFYENSGDIYGVKNFLGHSNISTTLGHYIGEDLNKKQKDHYEFVHYGGIVESLASKPYALDSDVRMG